MLTSGALDWAQRLVAAGGGIAALATVAVYRHDLKQLEFDAASALGPLLRLADAETSHRAGIWVARHHLLPVETRPDPAELHMKVWGRRFTNPIGVHLAGCCCPLPGATIWVTASLVLIRGPMH